MVIFSVYIATDVMIDKIDAPISLVFKNSLFEDLNAADLPTSPGVYVMYKGACVLYVGKARNIRKRVSDYTRKIIHDTRIRYMVGSANILKLHIASTEQDALFLEHLLIRTLNPLHNIKHRGDMAYPYFCLTNHDFPRIARYEGQSVLNKYGPYRSYDAMSNQMTNIQQAFLLRSCSDYIFRTRNDPCMLYHINRCSAPCADKISRKEYMEYVNEFNDYVTLYRRGINEKYKVKMQEHVKELEFEKAAMYRDRMKLSSSILSMNLVYLPRIKNLDVLVVYNNSIMSVSKFRDGVYKSHDIFFKNIDTEIQRIYKEPSTMIVTNYEPLAKKYPRVAIIPRRGDKRALMRSAYSNLASVFKYFRLENERDLKVKVELLDLLNRYSKFRLSEVRSIEAFDNSHLSGTHAVCGIVAKDLSYGKYKFMSIKVGNSKDDIYMIEYAVRSRLVMKYPLPDMFLIDGGINQINAAHKGMDGAGMIPVLGIAKKPDRIIDINNNVLNISDQLMDLFISMRDKVHSFVNSKNRQYRITDMYGKTIDHEKYNNKYT